MLVVRSPGESALCLPADFAATVLSTLAAGPAAGVAAARRQVTPGQTTGVGGRTADLIPLRT